MPRSFGTPSKFLSSLIVAHVLLAIFMAKASTEAGIVKKREIETGAVAALSDPDIAASGLTKFEATKENDNGDYGGGGGGRAEGGGDESDNGSKRAVTVESENAERKSTKLLPQMGSVSGNVRGEELRPSTRLTLNRIVENEKSTHTEDDEPGASQARHEDVKREPESEIRSTTPKLTQEKFDLGIFSQNFATTNRSKESERIENHVNNGLDEKAEEEKVAGSMENKEELQETAATTESILPEIEKIAIKVLPFNVTEDRRASQPSAEYTSTPATTTTTTTSTPTAFVKLEKPSQLRDAAIWHSTPEPNVAFTTESNLHNEVEVTTKTTTTTPSPSPSAGSSPLTLAELIMSPNGTTTIQSVNTAKPNTDVTTPLPFTAAPATPTPVAAGDQRSNMQGALQEMRTSGASGSAKRPKFINDNSTNAQQLNLPSAAEVWTLVGMKPLPKSNATATQAGDRNEVEVITQKTILNGTGVISNSEKNLLDWTQIMMSGNLENKKLANLIDLSGTTTVKNELEASVEPQTQSPSMGSGVIHLEDHKSDQDTTEVPGGVLATSVSTPLSNAANEVLIESTAKSKRKPDLEVSSSTIVTPKTVEKPLEATSSSPPSHILSTLDDKRLSAHGDSDVDNSNYGQGPAANHSTGETESRIEKITKIPLGKISMSNGTDTETKVEAEAEIERTIVTNSTALPETAINSSQSISTATATSPSPPPLHSSIPSTAPSATIVSTTEVSSSAFVGKSGAHNDDDDDNGNGNGGNENAEKTQIGSHDVTLEHSGHESTTAQVSMLTASKVNTTRALDGGNSTSLQQQNKNDKVEEEEAEASTTTTTLKPTTSTVGATTARTAILATTTTNSKTDRNSATEIKQIGNEVILETTTAAAATTTSASIDLVTGPTSAAPLASTSTTTSASASASASASPTEFTSGSDSSANETQSKSELESTNNSTSNEIAASTITTTTTTKLPAPTSSINELLITTTAATVAATPTVTATATATPMPQITVETITEKFAINTTTTIPAGDTKTETTTTVATLNSTTASSIALLPSKTDSSSTLGSVVEQTTTSSPPVVVATNATPLETTKNETASTDGGSVISRESEGSLETNVIDPLEKKVKTTTTPSTDTKEQRNKDSLEKEGDGAGEGEGEGEEDKEVEEERENNANTSSSTIATTTMGILILNSTSTSTSTSTEPPLISLLDDRKSSSTTASSISSVVTKIEEVYSVFSTTESLPETTTPPSIGSDIATTQATDLPKIETVSYTAPTVLTTTPTTVMLPPTTPPTLRASLGGVDFSGMPTNLSGMMNGGNVHLNGKTDSAGETDVNVIIAITVSVIGVVALLLLVAFLYLIRKRQKQMSYGQRCRPVSLDAYSLDNVSVLGSVRRKGALRASKRSYGNIAFDDPSLRHNVLTATELAKFVERRSSIFEEFRDVPQIIARADEVPAGCEDKNRYANVIPLPETRVILQQQNDDEKTEYINANYVRGPKDPPNYYIATQAPLEITVLDFWRMVWEQQSRVIIQATDLIENGIEKCAEYLPPSVTLDNHTTYGDFQITLKHREVKDKYAISTLMLKNTSANESRELTHYWYKWPETGVPTEEAPIIAMLLEARSSLKGYANELRDKSSTLTLKTENGVSANGNGSSASMSAEEKDDSSEKKDPNNASGAEINGNISMERLKTIAKSQGPLTIHCSPGTGRTGTIIACDMAIRSLETPKRSVDIPQIVYYVRRGRASAVQTKEQYEFIYKVANMYATKITNLSNDN